MIIVGTSYFPNKRAAVRYYAAYGVPVANVDRKIAEGEIHIGKPEVQPGDRVVLIDNGQRYAVETA